MTPKGMWFEDLEIGLVVNHPLTRTITEADNVGFSTQTMNPAPLHLDAAFASTTEFGKPLVNSLLTLGIVVGISVHELTHGTTVANLGFEAVRFPAPLFHGDTIGVETEVVAARPSNSKPDRGIVTLEHRAHNQDGVLVCTAVRNAMMLRRPD
ncbi:MAG: MaoC family dehydratase [Acidimicrobiales bacterium]